MNYMGVDIGTSGCKAVIFDEKGSQLASAGREYNIIFSSGAAAELNSDEVIKKCFDIIKECASNVEKNSVKGLGITSQGEAFTAVGFNNEILYNAMVSSDIRSKFYMDEFLKNFDEEKLYQITGHTAHPMFTLFKLLWFKDNKKDLWEKTKYFLCFEDLLQFKLGLDPKISWSLAGRTMMFDVRKHIWDPDIIRRLEISEKQLSKPMPSGRKAGVVDVKIAKELGLSEETFVVTGGHDQPCNAIGAGIVDEGIAMHSTGTVECITPMFKKPVFSDDLRKNNLCTYNYVIENAYTTVAFNLTGGNILKWFKDEFGKSEVAEAEMSEKDPYELILKQIDNKPSNLMVLPYFTPSGTPYFDSETAGAILGLRLSTSRGEILKALLEGISLEMRLNLEILENSGCTIKELRSVGGGAKSSEWTQLQSDVMNKKITVLNIKEAGCFGTAILARSAVENIPIENIVGQWVKPLYEVYPQEENVDWYNEKFNRYRDLYYKVKKILV